MALYGLVLSCLSSLILYIASLHSLHSSQWTLSIFWKELGSPLPLGCCAGDFLWTSHLIPSSLSVLGSATKSSGKPCLTTLSRSKCPLIYSKITTHLSFIVLVHICVCDHLAPISGSERERTFSPSLWYY